MERTHRDMEELSLKLTGMTLEEIQEDQRRELRRCTIKRIIVAVVIGVVLPILAAITAIGAAIVMFETMCNIL